MAEIKKSNYYTVFGWMINGLELKGYELQVYAIIYGFSQAPGTYFSAAQDYLISWTGASERTVKNVLHSLEEKGYIKRAKNIHGVNRVVFWQVNHELIDCAKATQQVVQNLHSGGAESAPQWGKNCTPVGQNLHHQSAEFAPPLYIDNNNKIDNTIYTTGKKKSGDVDAEIMASIINYLNSKAGTRYSTKSKASRSHINARIHDGYTVEDFFKVIDIKCAEWMGTQFQRFLCPETLFSTKFERYLNQSTGTAAAGTNDTYV